MSDPQTPENGAGPATTPDGPRWRAVMTPLPSGEAEVGIDAFAQDVTKAEIAFFLSKLLPVLIQGGGDRIATVSEQEAKAKLDAITRDHPATSLWSREGTTLWLSDLDDETQTAMRAAGWTYAGPVPDGVSRPCTREVIGSDAFAQQFLATAEA